MKSVNEMNKVELRAACKEVSVKGYGNMTNDQMRAAITAATTPAQTEQDAEFINSCGHANCPNCGVHLSNGVWEVEALIDQLQSSGSRKQASETNKEANFSHWCMACGNYFGQPRTPRQPVQKRDVAMGTGVKIEKNREERNGIKRPSAGGLCREVWDWCDAFSAANGKAPKPSDLKASGKDWNHNNAVAELYRWKKFVA